MTDLAVDNLPLVDWVVRHKFLVWGLLPARYSYDDAVAAGHVGLVQAADRYDPAKGQFSTIAVVYIRQAIHRDIGEFMGVSYRSLHRPLKDRPAWVHGVNLAVASLDAPVADGVARGDLVVGEADVDQAALDQVFIDAVFAACVDELDRTIVTGILDEARLREMAEPFGVHPKTVHNRIAAIRRKLIAGGHAPRPNFPRKEG